MNAGFVEKIIGIGYSNLLDLNESYYGVAIHTHSDFLDSLLIGGALLLIALLYLYIFMLSSRVSKPWKLGHAYQVAITLLFIVNGNLTGMFSAPNDMFALMAAWSVTTRENS